MVEGSEGDVIDYLLKSNKGEILKRGDRELNKLKIGETTYNYNKNKPHNRQIEKENSTKLNPLLTTNVMN